MPCLGIKERRKNISYVSDVFHVCPVQGILPNPAEMVVLEELTSELFETLPVDSDTLIPDPEPPTGQHTVLFVT